MVAIIAKPDTNRKLEILSDDASTIWPARAAQTRMTPAGAEATAAGSIP